MYYSKYIKYKTKYLQSKKALKRHNNNSILQYNSDSKSVKKSMVAC